MKPNTIVMTCFESNVYS